MLVVPLVACLTTAVITSGIWIGVSISNRELRERGFQAYYIGVKDNSDKHDSESAPLLPTSNVDASLPSVVCTQPCEYVSSRQCILKT